jgi:hypothetical protein
MNVCRLCKNQDAAATPIGSAYAPIFPVVPETSKEPPCCCKLITCSNQLVNLIGWQTYLHNKIKNKKVRKCYNGLLIAQKFINNKKKQENGLFTSWKTLVTLLSAPDVISFSSYSRNK